MTVRRGRYVRWIDALGGDTTQAGRVLKRRFRKTTSALRLAWAAAERAGMRLLRGVKDPWCCWAGLRVQGTREQLVEFERLLGEIDIKYWRRRPAGAFPI